MRLIPCGQVAVITPNTTPAALNPAHTHLITEEVKMPNYVRVREHIFLIRRSAVFLCPSAVEEKRRVEGAMREAM